MKLYELINPSDPYTFKAPNIEVAGVAAAFLSTSFGAKEVGGEGEQSPILFGWNEWMKDRGIDHAWIESHYADIADALESFLIGSPNDRKDVEEMLAMLPESKRRLWRARRQDRHRTSINQIGERAYQVAKALRDNRDEPKNKKAKVKA